MKVSFSLVMLLAAVYASAELNERVSHNHTSSRRPFHSDN
jgi:hypothetical protein